MLFSCGVKLYIELAKHPHSAEFLLPSGGAAPQAPALWRHRRPFRKPPPSAAGEEYRKNIYKKIWGAFGAPKFRRPKWF